MNDSPPAETPSSPQGPERRRGIFFRILLASVAPALLLAAAGVLIARSISPAATGPLAGSDFVPLFLLAAVLAALLALLLAAWIDIGIRGQLRVVLRALRSSRAPDLRGLATGDAWGVIGQLAEEAQSVLARMEEGAKSTAELAHIQRAADQLIERIRAWEETEDPPELPAEGPLADLTAPLGHLAIRLRDRDREARETADLTRESAAEARARIERAGKETERAAVEASALMGSLGELSHLTGALALRLQASVEEDAARTGPSAADEKTENRDQLRRDLDMARRLASSLSGRFEDMERRAIRAALQQAAGRLLLARRSSKPEEAVSPAETPPVLEVEELRQIASQCRESASSFGRLGEYLDEALSTVVEEPAGERPERTGPATQVAIDLCQRLEQGVAEARSKGERLAALAERANRHAAEAASASISALEDLQGLRSRFQTGGADRVGGVPGGEGDSEPPPLASKTESAAEPGSTGQNQWPKRSTPLRLLTREDVLPDKEPAAPGDQSSGSEETGDTTGKGMGDV